MSQPRSSRRCAECNHLKEMHGRLRCLALYSAGPSGTFRCRCTKYVKRPPPSVYHHPHVD